MSHGDYDTAWFQVGTESKSEKLFYLVFVWKQSKTNICPFSINEVTKGGRMGTQMFVRK